jgi:hypothetical protein
MELSNDKIYLTLKAYIGTFFASMVVIYLIFGFVAWGWSVGSWYWSIRLIHIAVSMYIAHYYHRIFITLFSEETQDDNNFFYDASKRNYD